MHIDEWKHYGDSRSLMEYGEISFPNPFDGGNIHSPDIALGYHLFLGELKAVTGISWLALFCYLPGVILALTAFQAYALGRRGGAGLGAAFLVVLIPTTVRLLGPAFLVPVWLWGCPSSRW
ncbi:hypothetical protein ACFLX5_01655 [Chloroflexota bacterium]